MNKLAFIIIFITNIGLGFSQEKLGVDYNPILNKSESEYFNILFTEKQNDFDFEAKKVAFVSVELEIRLRCKNDFFKYYTRSSDSTSSSSFELLVLDSIQNKKSNGYDAVILLDRTKNEISEKLINRIVGALAECEMRKPFDLYKLGLDNNPLLTESEARYFNEQVKEKRINFDFINKKVGFFRGNNGANLQSKSDYFNLIKERLGSNIDGSNDFIILLTNEEKNESGGYDAIIVSWSKLLVSSATNKMINDLRNNK